MSQAPAVWPPEMVVHRRFLWSLARLQLGNDDDAEDVVQETLLSAAESWERYRETTPLRAWLTGILKHKIVDVFRSRSRQSRRFCVSDDQDLWQPDNDFSENGSWNLETFIDHQCPEARASQNELLNLVEMCIPRWPVQIPPPVATLNSPRQDRRIMTFQG